MNIKNPLVTLVTGPAIAGCFILLASCEPISPSIPHTCQELQNEWMILPIPPLSKHDFLPAHPKSRVISRKRVRIWGMFDISSCGRRSTKEATWTPDLTYPAHGFPCAIGLRDGRIFQAFHLHHFFVQILSPAQPPAASVNDASRGASAAPPWWHGASSVAPLDAACGCLSTRLSTWARCKLLPLR